jgi:hypothetical protein
VLPKPPLLQSHTILVAGKREKVTFCFIEGEVSMYFKKRERRRIANEKCSRHYTNGDAYYQVGCELAWEMFPDAFE